MRLVCPNCDATYEVDASVIPDGGRDVQCSNCGHAWFQASPTVEAAQAEEIALFDAPTVVVDAASEPEPEPTHPTPARGLDETVLAVLREEAEREAAARRAEAAAPIETQTEMGLTAAPAPIPEPVAPAARRVARLKGAEAEQPPHSPRAQTRREMLPEIEEINSTLRATSEKRTGEPSAVSDTLLPVRHPGSGFRNGFLLAVTVAAIAVAVYVMAPRIGQQMPGAAPVMTSYVTTVDSARTWLDGVMQQAISALRGLSSDQPT